MDKYYKGKRLLVTGGCQGIGRGIALELWRLGANVVVLSNQLENLEKLKKKYPSIEIACADLLEWDKTRETVDSLGTFDGLVNNAGVAIIESFFECSPESFDKTMALNVRACLNVSQIVAKKMIENNIKGSVVNISSQASIAALKDHTAYCASKSAVDALTRVMALELGPYGIRVNSVNPTVIMTDMGRNVWEEPAKSRGMLSKIPLGSGNVKSYHYNVVMNNIEDIQRFGAIEDIADGNMADHQCIQRYQTETSPREDGRYIVRLPLKPEIKEKLGDSKPKAVA